MPPVIAIAAAVGSVSLGVSALAAGSSLIGGLMIAGGVASGLGALTGNKKLSMLGGVLGLAGGVAGLASGAWEGAANTVAQGAPLDAAGSLGQGAGSFDASTGGAGAQAASTNALGTPSASAAGLDTTAGDLARSPGVVDGSVANNTPDSVRAGFDAAPPARPSALDPTTTTIPPPAPDAPAAPDYYGHETNRQGPIASMDNPPGVPGGVVASSMTQNPSLWDRLRQVPKWIEDNKETAKIGGGLVGGAMQSYGQQAAQRQRFEMQRQYDAEQRQRYSNSIIGLHMPTYRAPAPV